MQSNSYLNSFEGSFWKILNCKIAHSKMEHLLTVSIKTIARRFDECISSNCVCAGQKVSLFRHYYFPFTWEMQPCKNSSWIDLNESIGMDKVLGIRTKHTLDDDRKIKIYILRWMQTRTTMATATTMMLMPRASESFCWPPPTADGRHRNEIKQHKSKESSKWKALHPMSSVYEGREKQLHPHE